MCSRNFEVSLRSTLPGKVRAELDENMVLIASVLDMTRDEPNLATNFWDSSAKARSWGYLLLGSQCEVFLGK